MALKTFLRSFVFQKNQLFAGEILQEKAKFGQGFSSKLNQLFNAKHVLKKVKRLKFGFKEVNLATLLGNSSSEEIIKTGNKDIQG